MLLTNEKKPQRGRAEASPIEGCWVGEYPAREDYRKFVSKCAVVCFKFYLSVKKRCETQLTTRLNRKHRTSCAENYPEGLGFLLPAD